MRRTVTVTLTQNEAGALYSAGSSYQDDIGDAKDNNMCPVFGDRQTDRALLRAIDKLQRARAEAQR
jgi:hypothetical protein